MKITLCCSIKYKPLLLETISQLENIGITALFPNLEENTKNKKQLALEQYASIDDSDAVYFLTPDGYMGTSCKLELGYAIAKDKPIYFSEPTHDEGLDSYVRRFVAVTSVQDFLEEEL